MSSKPSESPFSGHRFGLESPTGTRAVRGPTLFVLGLALALAIAGIVHVLLGPGRVGGGL